MRRLDRDNSSNRAVIDAVIKEADVIRIAVNDSPVPYVIPLCFGHEVVDDRDVFYFHKNRNGKFFDLIEKDNSCTVELEGKSELWLDHGKMMCNMDYASIIAVGHIEPILDEAERGRTMDLLMAHYDRGDFAYNRAAMSAILMYRVVTDSLTCKATKGWKEKRQCL